MAIQENEFPDLIKEPHAKESMKHLEDAKAYVEKLSRTRDTATIKIPNGVIVTTCPSKWDEHNKVYLRGSALK